MNPTPFGPPQPPGTPPEQWHQRRDVASRKVIDKLDLLNSEIEEVRRKLSTFVTYGWLVGVLGAAAVIIVGASWQIASGTRTEMLSAQGRMADDVRQLRAELAGKVASSDAQTAAIYKHLIEGRSKSSVAAEVRSATEGKP
jgi:hypothetical protein